MGIPRNNPALEAEIVARATSNVGVAPSLYPPDPRAVQSVCIELPWPPTVNTYWRSIILKGRVRVLVSAAGRDYRERVKKAVERQGVGVVEGRLYVRVVCHPPDKRARDLDNLPKGLLDALKAAGVFRDDADIDELHLVRAGKVEGGKVHVLVTVRTA